MSRLRRFVPYSQALSRCGKTGPDTYVFCQLIYCLLYADGKVQADDPRARRGEQRSHDSHKAPALPLVVMAIG